MRLLHVKNLYFAEFKDDDRPKYAMASHRWVEGSEVTLQDVQSKQNTHKSGYKKILNFARYVQEHVPSVEWLWVDTCCINKDSAAELSEAINLMFDWYRNAEVCIAYLADVETVDDTSGFKRSEWFKRGWTLQELLAPWLVVFVTRAWQVIGHKGAPADSDCGIHVGRSLERDIANRTGVPVQVLHDYETSRDMKDEEKFKWMEGRSTTKGEDMSYALYGIVGVAPGANYGEGRDRARERLHAAIHQRDYPIARQADQFQKMVARFSWPDPWVNHQSARQLDESDQNTLLQNREHTRCMSPICRNSESAQRDSACGDSAADGSVQRGPSRGDTTQQHNEETVVLGDSATYNSAEEERSQTRNHMDPNKHQVRDVADGKLVVGDVKAMLHAAAKDDKYKRKWRLWSPKPPRAIQLDASADVQMPRTTDMGAGSANSPQFSSAEWVETKIPHFYTKHKTKSFKLHGIARGFFKTLPFSCGIAIGGRHVFTLHEDQLTIFPVPRDLPATTGITCFNCLDPPSEPQGLRFHAAKMCHSSLAAICNGADQLSVCFLAEVSEGMPTVWHPVPDANGAPAGWRYTCLAIHHADGFVLIALGTDAMNASAARIELYKVCVSDWSIKRLYHIADSPKPGGCDPPKLLSFSPDGTLLVTCTRRESRLKVWQLLDEPGNEQAKMICTTLRSIGGEKDVLGITAATCWRSPLGHPYMLVTTSPCSQRGNNTTNEGEWSFIAPATDPFPPHRSLAFHCLVDAQKAKYVAIIDGAVSSKGNAIALVSTRGNICIMPLLAIDNGGLMASQRGLFALQETLKYPTDLFAAAVIFSEDDKRLIAVDKHGKLIIAEFDDDPVA